MASINILVYVAKLEGNFCYYEYGVAPRKLKSGIRNTIHCRVTIDVAFFLDARIPSLNSTVVGIPRSARIPMCQTLMILEIRWRV